MAIKAPKSASSSAKTYSTYSIYNIYDEGWEYKLAAPTTIDKPPHHTKLCDWWINVVARINLEDRGTVYSADFTTHDTIRKRHIPCGRAAKILKDGVWYYVSLDGQNLLGDEGRQAGVPTNFMENTIGFGIGSVAAIQNDAATTDDMVLGKVPTYSGKLVSARVFMIVHT